MNPQRVRESIYHLGLLQVKHDRGVYVCFCIIQKSHPCLWHKVCLHLRVGDAMAIVVTAVNFTGVRALSYRAALPDLLWRHRCCIHSFSVLHQGTLTIPEINSSSCVRRLKISCVRKTSRPTSLLRGLRSYISALSPQGSNLERQSSGTDQLTRCKKSCSFGATS